MLGTSSGDPQGISASRQQRGRNSMTARKLIKLTVLAGLLSLTALALVRTAGPTDRAQAYPWSAHECETVSASFSKLPMVGPDGFTARLYVNGQTYYGEVHDEWWRTSRLVHFHGAHVPFKHEQGYKVSARATISFQSKGLLGVSSTYGGTKTDYLVHYHDTWRGNDCSLGSISISAK